MSQEPILEKASRFYLSGLIRDGAKSDALRKKTFEKLINYLKIELY